MMTERGLKGLPLGYEFWGAPFPDLDALCPDLVTQASSLCQNP